LIKKFKKLNNKESNLKKKYFEQIVFKRKLLLKVKENKQFEKD
jgi:hypothetical protein